MPGTPVLRDFRSLAEHLGVPVETRPRAAPPAPRKKPGCARCGRAAPDSAFCPACRPTVLKYARILFCWKCHANLLNRPDPGTCPKCGSAQGHVPRRGR